jgi:hypothetical protein
MNSNIAITPMSTNTGRSSTFSGEGASRKIEDRVTFGQIKDQALGRGRTPDEFCVKGTVTLIKHENDVWYKACSTPKCGKKVTEVEPGQWRCDKCDVIRTFYEPRYMLSLSAADHTGSAWLNAFNEVGRTILGKEAQELEALKAQVKYRMLLCTYMITRTLLPMKVYFNKLFSNHTSFSSEPRPRRTRKSRGLGAMLSELKQFHSLRSLAGFFNRFNVLLKC